MITGLFMSLLMYGQVLISGYIEPTTIKTPTNYVRAIEIARDGMVKRDGKEQCMGMGHTWSGSMYAMAINCDNGSAFLITDTNTYSWIRVWRYKFY